MEGPSPKRDAVEGEAVVSTAAACVPGAARAARARAAVAGEGREAAGVSRISQRPVVCVGGG